MNRRGFLSLVADSAVLGAVAKIVPATESDLRRLPPADFLGLNLGKGGYRISNVWYETLGEGKGGSKYPAKLTVELLSNGSDPQALMDLGYQLISKIGGGVLVRNERSVR